MSKIEKVKLTNFRVFSDKFNKVDFNNENGSPADFVCIYGQNGMGKTSFFDGIEWFSSGSIYRFEGNDIKKELKKYKGYILSNRNIDGNMDKSYVEVKYSDNCTVKRTVIRSTKEINEKGYRDYNKGRLNPKKFKMNIVNKQILPHDKIDSFIYAKSPSEKYEEWGNFWDIDGSQRKLFNKVYSVKKLITKRIESLEESYNKAIDDLKQLTVSDEKINEINNKIKEFNRTEEISKVKLKKLIKDENKITNVPTVSEIKKYKSRVNKMADTEILNREKIVYLIKFYKDYYSQKKTKLDTKIKNVKAQLDKYKALNVVGDIWFEEYNQWRQLASNLKLNNQQLKIKLESLDAKNEELGNICKKMEKWKKSIETLENEEQKFLCKSKVIEKVIEELSDKQSKKKVNIDTLEKLNILKKQNKNKISNLEEAKIKDEKDDFDIHVISISEDDKKFLELRKIYIDKYKNIIEEISKKSEAADKEKNIYNSCKNNFDELQKILIQVKGYIEKEKLSSCPVCHTPFNKVEILLSKINLDEQSDNCKRLYDKYQLSLSENEKSLTKKKELISKWNEECEKYKVSIGEKNFNLATQITNIIYQNKMIEESIKLEDGKINKFKEELNKICKYEGKLSEVSVKEWLNKIKTTYKSKLNESKKEKDEIFKLITLLDKETKDLKSKVKQLEDKNDNFYKKNINKVLVSKLDEMNTTKNLAIKEWEDFEIYFNSLNKQSQELEEENKEINNYIMEYEKYNYKNRLEGENLDYTQRSYSDYMLQVLKKSYIDFSELIYLINKKDNTIKNFKVKVDILDYINNELCNSDYNLKYTELNRVIEMEKNELKKYETCKKKIEDIFTMLKKYIEENIENVLGSKSMNQIYSIIEPNKEFKKLKIEVGFSNKEKRDEQEVPELYLESDGENNQTILPEYFFSTAQLNTVALSIFLGQALSMDLEVKTIFIDDPVGHFDDINVLAFVDLLRNIIKDGKWQIVISTHDESFYNLLKNKISNEYYNSKFITFSSTGRLC